MPEILTLLGSAFSTLSKLKEVADKIKDAEIKGLVADIQIELADVKIKLADVMNENTALKAQIQSIGKPQFPSCPHCGQRTWRVEESFRDPVMGSVGAMRRKMKCSSCDFSETVLFVPEQ